jgi:8-oxo-dGTP pyrophosphatase MutT (NUDIX family)
MRWQVHGRRELYRSPWVTLSLVDVEVPDVRRYEHHVIDGPDAAGVLVQDPGRGVLALWRHRFLSDELAWEIPGGMVEPDEAPEQAAARECVEESGWQPGPLHLLQRFHPIAGQSTQTFWLYGASTAEQVGPHAVDEAERVEWLPTARVREVVEANQVLDGLSVIALLHHLARRDLDGPK